MSLIARLARARREGRLGYALSSRLAPHLRGARYLLHDPAASRVRIDCPEYVTPSRDETERRLVRRIFDAFRKMKEDQRRASPDYLPSSQWAEQLDRAYDRFGAALRTDDVEPFHFFLANFGTWKEYHGVESTTLLRESLRSPLRRRWLANDVFLGQLRLWEWFHGGRRPLARLSYPRHGNQAGALIDGTFVGPGSFFNEIYGSQLAGLLDGIERPIIADLGGGYGKLGYFILRDLPRGGFLDFDLPETVCLAAYYLMKVWPERPALLYGEGTLDASALARHDLVFMPSYEIEKLPDRSIDLFVNKNSLGEMTQASVEAYVAHITRSTRSFFFHLNHELHPNVYDDGSRGLLGHEYPVPPAEFRLLMRYPDIGHLLHQGYPDYRMDIFLYLYERRVSGR